MTCTEPDPLILRWCRSNYWCIASPCKIAGYEIPEGFTTDLASIPPVVRIVTPPCGPWTRAAILHDYLYFNATIKLTRKDADDLFYQIMLEDEVAAWRRWAAYIAVRLFGFLFWSKRWPH
jgi:hypothetical protein